MAEWSTLYVTEDGVLVETNADGEKRERELSVEQAIDHYSRAQAMPGPRKGVELTDQQRAAIAKDPGSADVVLAEARRAPAAAMHPAILRVELIKHFEGKLDWDGDRESYIERHGLAQYLPASKAKAGDGGGDK